jgi:hypothetical protein
VRGPKACATRRITLRDRVTSLKKANEAALKRKVRKARRKKRMQEHIVLTKGSRDNILAQCEADQQIACEERHGGEQLGVSHQSLARCKRCREGGHNSRTCKKDT